MKAKTEREWNDANERVRERAASEENTGGREVVEMIRNKGILAEGWRKNEEWKVRK